MARKTQAQQDAENRDYYLNHLAGLWGESFAGVKESLRMLSDRDVRIMSDEAYGKACRGW